MPETTAPEGAANPADGTPKSITDLAALYASKGGRAVEIEPRLWEFSLPRRMVDGTCPLLVVGTVGWYTTTEGRKRVAATIHYVRERGNSAR